MKFDILKPEAFAGPGGNDIQEVFLFPKEGEATIHDKLFIVARNVGNGQEQSGAGEFFARTFADAMFQNTCADEPLTDEILREALLEARDMMEEKCPGTKGVQFAVLYMHRHGCLAAHLGDTHIFHVRPKGREMLYKSKSDDRRFSTDKHMEQPVKASITNVQYGDYFVLMAGEGSNAVTDSELMDVICEPVNDKTKAVRLKKMTAGNASQTAAIIVHVSGVMREAMDELLTDNEASLTAPITIPTQQPTPRPQPKEERKTTPPKVEKAYEEAPEEMETKKSGHEFPIVTVTALALVLMAVGIWFWAQKPVEEKVPEAPVEVKKSKEKDTINILKNTRPKPVNIDDPKAEEKKAEESSGSEEKNEDTGAVSADFKETMDSYEAFFDEYIEFMQKYKEDPSDLTLLSEYTDFLSKYTEYMGKLSAIDKEELSTADALYYAEVSARISKKLTDAAL